MKMNKEKYKFKVGDRVVFAGIESKDTECESCGHIETEFFYPKVIGSIKRRYYDFVIRSSNMQTTDKAEILGDGTILHRPYLSKIKALNTEPCYEIDCNGSKYYEGERQLKKIKT